MAGHAREISDGPLLVSSAEDGASHVVRLSGELDLANAPTAEAELNSAMKAAGSVVVDLRKLEFIDSTGIALLVDLIARNGDSGAVSFVPSEFAAVTRVLDLTGVSERMSLAGG